MIFFWLSYYLLLILICFFIAKALENRFLVYFFTPVLFGFFGAIWFLKPGNYDLAPISTILFLELFVVESNGLYRLLRPLLTTIFFLQILSLLYFFTQTKANNKDN